MNIPTHIISILAAMTVSGSTTVINGTLDRKDYVTTNEVLETLGGTWNKKQKCHVWTCDPAQALKKVLNAETPQINTAKERKKEFQFFGTPPELADRLIQAVQWDSWKPQTILEPSAGRGSIVQAINHWLPSVIVDTYELMEENRLELAKLNPPCRILGDDFLKRDKSLKWDFIAANPPFNKHQDIEHVRNMYESLNDGGRLVTVMGCHSFNATHKVDISFREWLESVNADVYPIAAGEFKSSGTMIPAKYVIIGK